MEQVCNQNLCTGCQACKDVCPVSAIFIKENDRGFFYPIIDADKCIDCHKCQKVCPAINPRKDFKYPLKTYAGWTKDRANRHYSTSGGFAYELSRQTIEKGGVVCGCRWNVDHAEHAIAETQEEIRQFQGSKYAYSDVKDCYPRIKGYLKNNRDVVFFGTGCQVAALKSYLHDEYKGLTTVDVLCHGIPSQKGLRDRISYEESTHGKKVINMRFRDKKDDVFHTYCKYTFEDGTSSYCIVYQDFFFRGFDTNYLLRPNCFSCQYAQDERVSDITLADFWGYTPGRVSFMKYHDGVSMALANTAKGLAIIESLDNIKKEERPYKMAKGGNRNLNGPQMKPAQYEMFWDRYLNGEDLFSLSKLFFPPRPISSIKKWNWKVFLGILFGPENMIKLSHFLKTKLRWLYGPFVDHRRKSLKDAAEEKELFRIEALQPGKARVFYLGITSHVNLGDMAQHYCIKKWIEENYPNHELVMVESDVVVNPKLKERLFAHLNTIWNSDSIIVFQSGYCTQDLGGNHPLMHRMVIDHMPDAKILMMPQTIYFQHEENKLICAENHNKAKNMLFLARDFVSYEMAKEMFPDIKVKAFPDIVTTLIGTLHYDYPRVGVCLCTRNDGEKLYSKEQINHLADLLEADGISVKQKDTQSNQTVAALRSNLKGNIEAEIESYSHYAVTITDRYHGTIFSLCAGTPVIIIKTTDHKVTTGADWFKGVYDDYVYVAEDLDKAYVRAKEVITKNLSHILSPYFKETYYDKLKEIFEA